jgi:hypothetical protein
MPRQPLDDASIYELRRCCTEEIELARLLKTFEDNVGSDEEKEVVDAWIHAHGDRMRATHPVKMLRLLERLDRAEEEAHQ